MHVLNNIFKNNWNKTVYIKYGKVLFLFLCVSPQCLTLEKISIWQCRWCKCFYTELNAHDLISYFPVIKVFLSQIYHASKRSHLFCELQKITVWRQPLSQHPYGKVEPVLFLNKYILKIAIKLQHIQEKPGETSQKAKDRIVTTKCSYTTETRQGKEGRNTGDWQERREDDRCLWMGCRKARGKSICSALMLLRAFSLSFVLPEQGVTFLRTLCDSGKRRYWSKLQVFRLSCFS